MLEEWPEYVSDDNDFVLVPLVDQTELRRKIWIDYFVEKIAKLCNLPSSQIPIPLPSICGLSQQMPTIALIGIVERLANIQRMLTEEDTSLLEQTVIYLTRLQALITVENLFEVVVATFVLTYKYHEDEEQWLNSFAFELGLSNAELHTLEVSALKLLNYDLFLQPQDVLQMVLWRYDIVSQQATQDSQLDAPIILQECEILLQTLIDVLKSELDSQRTQRFRTQFLATNQIPLDIKQKFIRHNFLFFHPEKDTKELIIPYPEVTCTLI